MEIKELVKTLRDMLPEKVDYADLVCAEGIGHHGYTYVYEDPEPYFIEEAANKLEKLSAENQQLRNDLIMQTALAQNGQSAIETNKLLAKQLNVAVEDIKRAIDGELVCDFCKHNHECQGEQCDKYVDGVGGTDTKGNYYDWEWTCMEFNFGTCGKLEDTPCNGCFENDMSGFEWRGVKCE